MAALSSLRIGVSIPLSFLPRMVCVSARTLSFLSFPSVPSIPSISSVPCFGFHLFHLFLLVLRFHLFHLFHVLRFHLFHLFHVLVSICTIVGLCFLSLLLLSLVVNLDVIPAAKEQGPPPRLPTTCVSLGLVVWREAVHLGST